MNTLNLLYEVIDEMNLDLELDFKLEKDKNAIIFGHNSKLDSMGLINFITLVEEKLEAETGKFITIADERAMSMEENPFKTVESLAKYLDQLLNEQ
jgi:hypothetical protein